MLTGPAAGETLADMANAPAEEDLVIDCVNRGPGGFERRITVDAGWREVTFVNCLWPRRFLAGGYEAYHRCGFADVLTAHGFGVGRYRRLHVGTRRGRRAVSPDWDGYESLRAALGRIATGTASNRLLDDPRVLMP